MLDEPMTTDESTPPAEDEDTIGSTVPYFFQDEDEPGPAPQVGVDRAPPGALGWFFARFLRVPDVVVAGLEARPR